MKQYYYLIASLPALSYEKPMPIGVSEFQERCRTQLSERDYGIFIQVQLEPPLTEDLYADVKISVLRNYWGRETSLRNELIRLRSQEYQVNGTHHIRAGFYSPDTHEIAKAAYSSYSESPLRTEFALSRARWSYLSQLETGNFFNIHLVIIYYLKLLILEVKHCMNREDGIKKFQEHLRALSVIQEMIK